MRLSMYTVFKFNRSIIVTNTFKHNLAAGIDLKKAIKVSLSLKIMSVVKISMKIQKDT